MTAPQIYSVQEEKNRTDSAVCEKKRPEESLHERVDGIVLDLYVLCGSLGTFGELMLGADMKCHSVEIGEIVDHYTGLINEGLGRIEECLTALRREERV